MALHAEGDRFYFDWNFQNLLLCDCWLLQLIFMEWITVWMWRSIYRIKWRVSFCSFLHCSLLNIDRIKKKPYRQFHCVFSFRSNCCCCNQACHTHQSVWMKPFKMSSNCLFWLRYDLNNILDWIFLLISNRSQNIAADIAIALHCQFKSRTVGFRFGDTFKRMSSLNLSECNDRVNQFGWACRCIVYIVIATKNRYRT